MFRDAQGPPWRDRSQNNPTLPPHPPMQQQQYYWTTPEGMHPDRAAQLRQVDSWRSYKDDDLNLQSSLAANPYLPLGSCNANITNSAQSTLNARAPAFTPYQPLRVSDGTRERQILEQALQEPQTIPKSQSSNHRYPLRNRQSRQRSPLHISANTPIPTIETGFIPLSTSAHLTPSSLPPRVTNRRSYSQTPNVKPPKRPTATAKYLKAAGRLPETIDSPKKLLVILDLNGTLLVRPKRWDPKSFKLRPGVTGLLEYLFANHAVMVYSSARPANVIAIVEKLFHPKYRSQLAGIWARDKLELNKEQYDAKVQVYKKLDKIWNDPTIQASAGPGQKWNQTNTVLVDDSHVKAAAQPHNLVQVPEFENNAPKEGGDVLRTWQLREITILKSLEERLEELKYQVDVSRLIREWQTGKRSAPGVVDETIDQKTQQNVQEQLPRGISPTPTPSLQSCDDSQPASAQRNTYSPQSARMSSTPGHGSDTTKESLLEEEMNRSMKNTHLDETDNRLRSESPIGESVFAELLGRGGANKAGKEKDSV